MKTLKLLFGLVVFYSIACNVSIAQMQDVSWKDVPNPTNNGDVLFSQKAQIDYLSNNKWYFTYYDESTSTLNVKRFNIETQSWTLLFSSPITNGWYVSDVDTYMANDKLYIGIATDQEMGDNFSLWEMDLSENINAVIQDENSSVPLITNSRMEFVVVNDQLFLASVDFSGWYNIDTYNLTSYAYETSVSVGPQSFSSPDIVVDHSDNSLVVSGNDGNNFYYVYKSSIGASLNFTPMNGNGFVNSALFAGDANGNYFKLVEKIGDSPEAVFIYSDGGTPNLYRLGIYSNSSAGVKFVNPEVLSGTSVAQFGDATYISGLNGIVGNNEMWEVDPSGTRLPVADNTNPTLELSTVDGLITTFAQEFSGRAAAFYHFGTGDGTTAGNFKITNTAPILVNSTSLTGCVGSSLDILEDVTFDDTEGDPVKIISGSFTSSDQNVVDAASISAFESTVNNWSIQAQGLNAGSVTITFDYTDGIDTITSSALTVEFFQPAAVSFTSTSIEFCRNDGVVDLNDYVDSTGGSFMIGDFTSEDGTLSFDTLDILLYPFTDFISYEYEDQNGCYSYGSADLTIYNNPSASLNVTNSACGNSNGAITASISSPNGAYSNYWNTGDQDVLNISGLVPGTYYHNIVDDKGCVGMSQANVQASDVNVTGTISNVNCYGGSDGGVQLSINGANGPYNVLWSSGHSSPNVQGLSAGSYTATVSNGNGCVVSQSFIIMEPTPIEMEYLMTYPDCGLNNGAVEQSFIQGGTGNYSYLWTSGGTGQDMIGVPSGTYGVQVTDISGCTVSKSFQLNPVNGAGVYADVTKAVCGTNSGSIELDVFPAFGETVTNILWSNGATTEDIYNLAPGNYTCEIDQSNGCTAEFTWNVKARKAPQPDICIVTVDTSTTTNLVVWEKPALNVFDIHHYNIYRETNQPGQFQLIDTVHYSSISVFNDVVASPTTRSWRYRISAVTSCGTESIPSSVHKTIHMVINDLGNGDYKIVWDNYEGFLYSTYDLLRYTDLDGQWTTIDAGIPFNALPNTIDTPTSVLGLNYMIEVTPPGGICTATEGKAQDYNSSRSNKPKSVFNPGNGTGDPNNSIVTNENEDYTIALYPNPSDGYFEVALYHEQSNIDMTMTVLNLQGQTVYKGSIKNGVNYIDLRNVESGVYVVNVEDGNTSERIKIVIK